MSQSGALHWAGLQQAGRWQLHPVKSILRHGEASEMVYMKGFRGSSAVTCPLGGALTQLKTLLLPHQPSSETGAAGSGSLLKQDPSFFPSCQWSGRYGDMVFHQCLQEGQAPAASRLFPLVLVGHKESCLRGRGDSSCLQQPWCFLPQSGHGVL